MLCNMHKACTMLECEQGIHKLLSYTVRGTMGNVRAPNIMSSSPIHICAHLRVCGRNLSNPKSF